MFRVRGEPLLFRGYILGFTRMGFVKHPITPQASVIGDPASNGQRGMDGVRKNANEVHNDNCFRNGLNFVRK